MRHRRRKQSGHNGQKSLFFLSLFAILLIVCIVSFGYVAAWRSDWDGESRLTLVWEKQSEDLQAPHPIGIFSIDPTAGKAVYIKIPESALLDVPYGYKTYLASSVYRLGELDSKRNGGMLLAKSIEATMGIAIDGYVVSSDVHFPQPPDTADDLSAIKKSHFSLPGLFRYFLPYAMKSQVVHTDVGPFTWYRVWSIVRKIRTDQIRFLDLAESVVLEDQVFPDGTVGKAVNIDAFDTYIGDQLVDMRIRSQEASIEVVNATGQERLASKFGTVLERLGGHVIVKSTGKALQQESCLFYTVNPDLRTLHIISYLSNRRGCREGTNTQITPVQSDILVVLGEEFVR